MFTKTFGNTTVHFEVLIVAIAIILVLALIRSLYLVMYSRGIVRAYLQFQYNKVILKGNKLLKIFQRSARLLHTKKSDLSIDNLKKTIAISYFSIGETEKFLDYMKDSFDDDTKFYWMAIYESQQGRIEEMKKNMNQIEQKEENQTRIDCLDGIYLYYNNQVAEAQNKLKSVYPKLQLPIIQQIVGSLIE